MVLRWPPLPPNASRLVVDAKAVTVFDRVGRNASPITSAASSSSNTSALIASNSV
jgi:hypothetical protein